MRDNPDVIKAYLGEA
ncbi:TPA: hypothetical protein ACUT5B_003202 [Pseudomonas aeruginosa]|nr:hypothetical protein [Pseudomonas aeruginosa]